MASRSSEREEIHFWIIFFTNFLKYIAHILQWLTKKEKRLYFAALWQKEHTEKIRDKKI